MKELIKVTQNDLGKVVSARELYEFLGIKSRFNDWVKNRIKEYGFVENQDFVAITKNLVTAQGNKSEQTEYAISLDMAKELAMVERNEKGREARQYFIACEKELKASKKVVKLSSPRVMRRINPAQLADMLYNCCFVEAKNVREALAVQLYSSTLCTIAKKGGQDAK
jgi:anti-repressor protein